MSVFADALDNGLRLRVESVPQYARGLAAVALTVGAGGDDDPAGRHGMAHLVEHLMFPRAMDDAQDTGHVARIEGAGGVCNAETHRDHTVFHTSVPADMLGDVLEWEARRLLDFAPADEVIRTETGVIAEEIRGAASGGRVWDTALAALLPGSRDSFGTASALAGARADEVAAFFRWHYTADRMVLSVVGDVEPERVAEQARGLFAEVAPAPSTPAAPATPSAPCTPEASSAPSALSAPIAPPGPATSPVQGPAAPLSRLPSAVPGAALGHPLPDPVAERAAYLAHVVLAQVLGRSRLPLLTRGDRRLTSASVTCGYYGQWLGSAAPDLALVLLGRAPGVPVAAAVESWLDVLREAAAHPVSETEHRRALNSLLVACHRQADSLTARAVGHGRTELLFGGAGGADALPGELARVTPDEVSAAARALLDGPRSVIELQGEPR
ncbi:pitrilysin family protein [Streptomyces sp. NPDC051907]|uniref:M16 family metallopeptidase n=1 Tax=Streptomyces sp. NPDC051907 TaxID=3155284 RepID=UPI0034444D03